MRHLNRDMLLEHGRVGHPVVSGSCVHRGVSATTGPARMIPSALPAITYPVISYPRIASPVSAPPAIAHNPMMHPSTVPLMPQMTALLTTPPTGASMAVNASAFDASNVGAVDASDDFHSAILTLYGL